MTRQPKTHLQHMRDDPLLVFDEAEDYMFIWKQVHRFLMKDVKVCCRGCSMLFIQIDPFSVGHERPRAKTCLVPIGYGRDAAA